MEVVVLAGGLGTRLRSEVKDVPKPMAPIQGRPFMEYLLDQLVKQGVTKVIFSVGHKSEIIEDHFGDEYRECKVVYAREEKRLGTGGAILNAVQYCEKDHVLVVNGDSIFKTDVRKQLELHVDGGADVTLALKPMKNIERYGTVDLDDNGRVVSFNEKQPLDSGLINTGTYLFKVQSLRSAGLPEVFSIEKDFFETHLESLNFLGYESEGYFLDIGIPEDFKRAQYEIGLFPRIDRSWTLFLDRDGVINRKREADYVKSISEFQWLPGAAKAVAEMSELFGRVVVVTNQQGIGKGLMTEEDLDVIHAEMLREVEGRGGKIDLVLHAPKLASANSIMRKPEIGMALRAQEVFSEINFSKSIMIGDSPSDMQFARNAGIHPVRLSEAMDVAYSITSLSQLSSALSSIHS